MLPFPELNVEQSLHLCRAKTFSFSNLPLLQQYLFSDVWCLRSFPAPFSLIASPSGGPSHTKVTCTLLGSRYKLSPSLPFTLTWCRAEDIWDNRIILAMPCPYCLVLVKFLNCSDSSHSFRKYFVWDLSNQ